MLTEADTCRKFVVPKLQMAGWENDPHSIAEQRTITDGRIVPAGKGFLRKPSKKVDYQRRGTGMNDYEIVFKKLEELEAQLSEERSQADRTELDDIEELRRFAAEISEPEPTSFTTT